MASIAARLLRVISLVVCVIVALSFGVFAIQQAKGASNEQSQQLDSEVPGAKAPPPTHAAKESSLHRKLDEASNKLTSPFNGIVSGFSSEWASRGVKLVLALLVYGFALGYLARLLSVRA